jgi:hypothetical protein
MKQGDRRSTSSWLMALFVGECRCYQAMDLLILMDMLFLLSVNTFAERIAVLALWLCHECALLALCFYLSSWRSQIITITLRDWRV